jgi:glycosyltransferase involved in cell wall biosynthesis
MNKVKVSVVIPVYKPDEEIFNLLKESLNKQTIKPEIIEKWNNPEAVSMNLGIKEAKGEFIIILAQDCVPENEFWIEKMIKPLENKEISAVVSDLILPKKYWEKRPFFVRMFTMADLKLRKPSMNLSSCAYRKKDLEKIGYINEQVSAIDGDFNIKIRKLGKITRGNAVVYHIHPHKDYKKTLKTFYNYAKFNGLSVKQNGLKEYSLIPKVLRAIPFVGLISIYVRYPLKGYFYLLPIHFLTGGLIDHLISVTGFWNGFFFAREDGERNKEVLTNKK